MGCMALVFLIAVAFLLVTAGMAFSQSGKGRIAGRVLDKDTGEPLPGVNIIVQGTYYGAASDAEGRYEIRNVNPGVYTLVVSMIGYKKVQQTGVQVNPGARQEIDFMLEPTVLAFGQEVVVIGERPLFNIEETSTRRGLNAEELAVSTLENVQDIVGSQVGVVASDDEIHIRGGRSYENAYLLDGVSVQDPLSGTGFGLRVSTEAIEEIEVITGGFNAEYGQAMSGIVKVKTKEGGEKYHISITYKRDHFGDYSADTPIIGTFSRKNPHSFLTDIAEVAMSGPEPFTQKLLPALGVNLPGTISFFASGYMHLSHDYTRNHASTLYSSIFGGDDFTFRENNLYSVLAKLTWKASPTQKVTFDFSGSVGINQNTQSLQTNLEHVEPGPGYPYSFSKNLDGFNVFTHINNKQSLAWVHTLNQKTFFELRLSRYFAHLRSEAGGKHWREYIEPAQYPLLPLKYFQTADGRWRILPDGFYTAGNGFTWHDHYVEDYSLDFDITMATSNNRHEVKAGVEATYRTMQLIDIFAPWIGKFGLNNDIYRVHPNFGAFYVQDKIVFQGLIANVGLRMDYWFPGEFVDNAVQNPEVLSISENTRKAYLDETYSLFGHRWKARLSPRIGISHPISDNQMLFFSYGHFSKLPKPQFIYAKLGVNASKASFQRFGNPNLNPETTVAYELGLKQKFTENDVLTLTAYYKDIFDYINTVSFRGSGRLASRSFLTYLNADYARVRGVELEYKKRAGKYFTGTLSGSYSFATGKSFSPDDGLLVANGTLNERPITEELLPWDRPWQFTLNLNVNIREGEAPKLFGFTLPDNWNLYLNFFTQAGRRYTPQFRIGTRPDGRPEYSADRDQNGDVDDPWGNVATPWRWVDVNFEKYFRIGALNFVFNIEARNIFDWKNTNIVNPVTGRGYERGDATPSSWNDPLFPDLQSPTDPYPFNPARYLAPRNVRLGFTVRY